MSTPPFPALGDLQMLLARLIRAPEGVLPGLESLVENGDLDSTDLSFAVEANERMTPAERLDIYASMYFYRLHDCLADDFPRTRQRIGDAHFNNLITDYLLAHPPSHYSLREAGRALPDYVATHALAETFPALSDVARLEWARLDVFDDRDAEPLDRERFLEASATNPEAFRVRTIPAARILLLDSRARRYWDDPSATEVTVEDASPESTLLVWRKGFSVLHRVCEEDEDRCLEVLSSSGITLPELAELLLKPDASAERTSERFASLLELWLQNELLVDETSLTR